jgi:hypothetical protein
MNGANDSSRINRLHREMNNKKKLKELPNLFRRGSPIALNQPEQVGD